MLAVETASMINYTEADAGGGSSAAGAIKPRVGRLQIKGDSVYSKHKREAACTLMWLNVILRWTSEIRSAYPMIPDLQCILE
jgi:hypothetical protein